MGTQVNLWASTESCGPAHTTCGQPSSGSFGCPRTYHGRPTTASIGCPIMWPTPRILGNHSVASGAPRYCVGLPQYCLGDHEILWTPNEPPYWTSTRIYGRPRELVDTHARLWAPISRNMDGHHALMGDHHAICGHPAYYRGRSRYADGVPRLFLGAYEKNVDFHAFWVDCRNILWASTELMWLATGNMWSLTHLAGPPLRAMEAHCAIVDTHHNIVGDHDANCWRVWTSRRDIVGAHVFCVGVCGRVYFAHVDAHV